jgi:hypothetical protein
MGRIGGREPPVKYQLTPGGNLWGKAAVRARRSTAEAAPEGYFAGGRNREHARTNGMRKRFFSSHDDTRRARIAQRDPRPLRGRPKINYRIDALTEAYWPGRRNALPVVSARAGQAGKLL